MKNTQTGIQRSIIEKVKDAINNFFWDLPWIRFRTQAANFKESIESSYLELNSNGQIRTDKVFIDIKAKKIPYVGKLKLVIFSNKDITKGYLLDDEK